GPPVRRGRHAGAALLPGPRVVARRAPRRPGLAPGGARGAAVLLPAAVLVAAAAAAAVPGLPRRRPRRRAGGRGGRLRGILSAGGPALRPRARRGRPGHRRPPLQPLPENPHADRQ